MNKKIAEKRVSRKRAEIPKSKISSPETAPPGKAQFEKGRFILLAVLLLAIICSAVYFNSLSNGFVWDDQPLILKDKTIKDLRNIPRAFTRDYFAFTGEEDIKYGYFRPIITISFMVDYAIWGANPLGFHLTNFISHTACTILVFWIFMQLGLPYYQALLGAIIFGVHPIHTESVSWISGRTDLFCGLFFLASLGAYIAYRKNLPSTTNFRGRKTWAFTPRTFYVLSLIFYSLCLLSKEMGVTFILVVFVLERFYFCKADSVFSLKASLIRTSPYFLLTGGYLYWHFITVKRLGGNMLRADLANLYPNVVTFFKGFWIYVYKLLFPFQLSAYLKVEMLNGLIQPIAQLCFFMFIVFCYTLKTGAKQKTLFGLGGGMFLATMLPLTNITRITSPQDMGFTMAERFMYIPSIGFILLLVTALDWGRDLFIKRYPKMERLPLLLTVFLIGMLGYGTILRNRDWRNDQTLFTSELTHQIESPLIHGNLGMFYANDRQFDKAIYHLQKAIKMSPDTSGTLNNLAQVLLEMNKFSEALPYLEKALSISTSDFQIYNNYGLAVAGLGQYQKAIQAYQAALDIDSSAATVYNNLGVAYKKTGDFKKAEECYLAAIKYDESYAAPYKNIAILYWENLKQPAQAIAAMRKSLKLDPKQREASGMREFLQSIESRISDLP
jgi:Tfp pilus assembly protein PilF